MVYGYDNKSEYQSEVVKIILSDEKYNIFYVGLTEDIYTKQLYQMFIDGNKKGERKEIRKKWKEFLVKIENPKYIIVKWSRLTNICVYRKNEV